MNTEIENWCLQRMKELNVHPNSMYVNGLTVSTVLLPLCFLPYEFWPTDLCICYIFKRKFFGKLLDSSDLFVFDFAGYVSPWKEFYS